MTAPDKDCGQAAVMKTRAADSPVLATKVLPTIVREWLASPIQMADPARSEVVFWNTQLLMLLLKA